MKKLFATAVLQLCASTLMAQLIDFDLPGKTTPGKDTEIDYISWAVPRAESDTKRLDNGMTLTITAGGAASAVGSNWSKTDVEGNGLRMIADEVLATNIVDGNLTQITNEATSLILTISGMTPGLHTLRAYHNNSDVNQTQPDIKVSVDGVVKATGVKFTSSARSVKEAGSSFVTFTATEGQPVVISYTTCPEAGKSYTNCRAMLNGLEFDVAKTTITDPVPAHQDYHVDADDGSVTFSWQPAAGATQHKLVYGTDETEVATSTSYQYEGQATSYTAMGFHPLQRYYWRVDEVDGQGVVNQGTVYCFEPRRLAFPGAEGYGRYAIGGRGGTVYHVTTLDDNGDDENPIEGSLRYGIKKVSGPRTIVFDVAGVIALKSRLMCGDRFVTIAGQTAPAQGILLRTCPFGMQSDGITRFLRLRLGHKKLVNGCIPGGKNSYSYGAEEGTSDETTLGGLDGMGMAGNDHAIMDHCSISWTIDEAFSSRNAKGLTLQHTLISEALNQAGHPNYSAGDRHGYAATIGGGEMGGQPGSYHHNLLAHCEGRNWSISGGLDGSGNYDGHHDIYNNVVYNWGGRATDGGTHEMNFCNNYYKMGANSTKTLMNLQLEGTGSGTQSVYVAGNIRQAKNNGALSEDKRGDTYTYSTSGGQKVDWNPLPSSPFSFLNPEGNMETARAAFKNVLSDVGCSLPFLDLHDRRMVSETLSGTTTTKGSRSGRAGLIDSEEDAGCEGFDMERLGLTEARRDSQWDTDQDGIPNWFEAVTGTNPDVANNNDDRDGDYYTDLEEYLNWVAVPNFILADGQQQVTIDLSDYFAGYAAPAYTASPERDNGTSWTVSNGRLTFSDTVGNRLTTVEVTATEDGIQLTRAFHFAATSASTGIRSLRDGQPAAATAACYDLSGRRVDQGVYTKGRLAKGIYISHGRKHIVR